MTINKIIKIKLIIILLSVKNDNLCMLSRLSGFFKNLTYSTFTTPINSNIKPVNYNTTSLNYDIKYYEIINDIKIINDNIKTVNDIKIFKNYNYNDIKEIKNFAEIEKLFYQFYNNNNIVKEKISEINKKIYKLKNNIEIKTKEVYENNKLLKSNMIASDEYNKIFNNQKILLDEIKKLNNEFLNLFFLHEKCTNIIEILLYNMKIFRNQLQKINDNLEN